MIARKYNFKITPNLVYLIESLKVEGYWNPKYYTASIQNKNLIFLNKIESIIAQTGIKPYKRILIKVKLNKSNIQKKDVELFKGSKVLNFHIETSPFDGSKRIVTNQPYSPINRVEFES